MLCIPVKGCIDPTSFVSRMSISPTITMLTPGYPDFTPRNCPTSSADAHLTGPKQKLLVNKIYVKEFVAANYTPLPVIYDHRSFATQSDFSM